MNTSSKPQKSNISPKISVVITCYNQEKYISECLESVLEQSFTDFEIICIDDGSTDNSSHIIQSYCDKDNRIRMIQQKNKGVVIARNIAISNAKGEYIYILDGDDKIDKYLLEKAYEAIISHKGDIITCKVFSFGETNQEYRLYAPTKLNMSCNNCLVNAALFSKKLFDKSGGFDPAFNKGLEDYDFWLNMVFRQNCHIYRIPEILFFYRIKTNFESRNKQQSILYSRELNLKLEKKYPEIKKYRIIKRLLNLIFQIKIKKNKTVIRIFKLPIITIKHQNNKKIWNLLGFIPVFSIK